MVALAILLERSDPCSVAQLVGVLLAVMLVFDNMQLGLLSASVQVDHLSDPS